MINTIQSLKNIECKLNEMAGPAVALEVRMRLIAQCSVAVRDKLRELYAKDKGRCRSADYWDCNLVALEDAIIEVFSNFLGVDELEKMKKFRDWRNKFLHGDFVTNLMKFIGIAAEGRELLLGGDKRNALEVWDIKEAILSVERNNGLRMLQILINEVISILDHKIIYKLNITEDFTEIQKQQVKHTNSLEAPRTQREERTLGAAKIKTKGLKFTRDEIYKQ